MVAVRAVFSRGDYAIGQNVSDAEIAAINRERCAVCLAWEYTIRPWTPLPASA